MDRRTYSTFDTTAEIPDHTMSLKEYRDNMKLGGIPVRDAEVVPLQEVGGTDEIEMMIYAEDRSPDEEHFQVVA